MKIKTKANSQLKEYIKSERKVTGALGLTLNPNRKYQVTHPSRIGDVSPK
jgi:hypothetical protein